MKFTKKQIDYMNKVIDDYDKKQSDIAGHIGKFLDSEPYYMKYII